MNAEAPRPSEAQIREALSSGEISRSTFDDLVDWSVSPPTSEEWHWYFRKHCLVLGWLLVISGVVFFGAYNWSGLSRFAKFGILEVLIVAGFCSALMRKVNSLVGETLLVSSAVLVGVLLAVFGQVYQTGADSFKLFLAWSLLILPWCVGGRSNALWFLEWLLVNLTFGLWWYQTVNDDFAAYSLAHLALNLCLAYLAELTSKKLDSSWSSASALLAIGWIPVTISACIGFWEGELYLFGLLPLLAALAAAVYFRRDRLEYMTLVSASLLTLGGGLLLRMFIKADEFGFLMVAMGILAEISLAARWLKSIHVRNQSLSRSESTPVKQEADEQDVARQDPAQALAERVGMSTSEARAVLEADPGVPFHVHLLTGFGAWIASLFLMGFLVAIVSESEFLTVLVGAGLAWGSIKMRPKVQGLFGEYACLCVALASPAMVLFGLTSVAGEELLPSLTLLISSLALYFYPDKLGRFLFANGVVFSGHFMASDVSSKVGGNLWLVAVLSGLVFLGWDSQRHLKGRWGELLRPACLGFSTAFMAIMFTTSWNHLDFKPAMFLALALAILTVLTAVWSRAPMVVILSLAGLSAVTFSVPGFMAAVLLSLLAFHSRFHLMAILAEAFILAFGTFYYYQLDTSLLAKSSILVGSGLLLLFTRFLLRKRAHQRGMTDEQ